MHLIREDQLLKGDPFAPQRFHELNRLPEGHIGVVIAMHQQDRRLPALDVRDGRRIERQPQRRLLHRKVVGRQEQPRLSPPVVYAVQVHSRREKAGGAGQPQSGQVAAVRASP